MPLKLGTVTAQKFPSDYRAALAKRVVAGTATRVSGAIRSSAARNRGLEEPRLAAMIRRRSCESPHCFRTIIEGHLQINRSSACAMAVCASNRG